MLPEIIKVRDRLAPKSSSNIDPTLFNYKFWTDLEKLSKKHRTLALDAAQKLSDDASKVGTIVSGGRFILTHSVSNPISAFDKEVFIEKILEKYPSVSRHELRELATASVVEGSRRHTYSVEEKE